MCKELLAVKHTQNSSSPEDNPYTSSVFSLDLLLTPGQQELIQWQCVCKENVVILWGKDNLQ